MNKAIIAAAGLIGCIAAGGYLLCGSPAVHRDTVERGPVGARDDGGTGDARRGDGRSLGFMSRLRQARGDEMTQAERRLLALTDELRELDEAPSELWLPNGDGADAIDAQIATLRRLVPLARKIQAGDATREESRTYHETTMRLAQARIEHLQGVVESLQNEPAAGGDRGRDIETGNRLIQDLVKYLDGAQKKLEDR